MLPVKGNYHNDTEIRVYGTITIPQDWVSGKYTLLIEAYGSVGSRKAWSNEINLNLTITKDYKF